MSERNDSSQLRSDAQLEQLLREFFQAELPEPLRELRPVLAERRESVSVGGSTPRAVTARMTTSIAVVVMAVCMISLVSVGPREASHDPLTRTTPGEIVRDEPAAGALSSMTEIDDRSSPAMERVIIERYDTPRGPVEQRTNMRWMVSEPNRDSDLEAVMPELTIEVYGIDDVESPPR